MNLGEPCHCASARIAPSIMRGDRFMHLRRLPGEAACSGAGAWGTHIGKLLPTAKSD